MDSESLMILRERPAGGGLKDSGLVYVEARDVWLSLDSALQVVRAGPRRAG